MVRPHSIMADEKRIPIKPLSVQQYIVKYAQVYHVKEKLLLDVAFCESGYNQKAWNKKDPGVGSKGFMQFQEGTYYSYAKKIGIEKPDIWNNEHQAKVSAYMFSIGEGKQWSCYSKVKMVK